MPTISKPCFCCSGCCKDSAHADLLADNAMVTLPDIAPASYPACQWTTIYTATVKSDRKAGLNPVFVNIGSNCDRSLWIRPKYTHKCAQSGDPGTLCHDCVKNKVVLGGELFMGWFCDNDPREQAYAGYAPVFMPPAATACGYVKLEWQIYTSYRPLSTSCTPPDPLTCGSGPNSTVHNFSVEATPTLVKGTYPLGSTGLFKVPRRCTWKLRYTNKVTMNLEVTGDFGSSNRNITGIMTIGAFSQHVDCQGDNSHTYNSTPPGICTAPCVDSGAACCGVTGCSALLDTPFWYPVGSQIGTTPYVTRMNPLPIIVSAEVAVVGDCRCPHDQFFQIDFAYIISGRA